MRGWRCGALGTTATLTALLVAGTWVNPALACGCGAMVAEDDVSVSRESSLVHWDGATQTIVMGLDVETFEDEAALLLPTPEPAEVELGEDALFDELSTIPQPREEYHDDWWPDELLDPALDGVGAQDGASDSGAVDVLSESEIGPFEVSTLSADDPDALRTWLDDNDYQVADDLAEALDTYVQEGWYYAAVRLGTEDGDELSGGLDPLRVTFEAEELVYPMRLSRQAEVAQDVRLYLLADHRVTRVDDDAERVPGDITYAGWVDPDDVDVDGLTELMGDDPMFLTTMDHDIADPETITADFAFEPASENTEFRRVEHVDRPVYLLGVAGGPLLTTAGLMVGGALVMALVFLLRGRRS